MWTWILSPWGRKVAIGIATAIALCAIARWYGNRQYYAGVEKGKASVASDLERAKKAEWAERERDLAARSAELEGRIRDVASAAEAVNAARGKLLKDFNATLAGLENDKADAYRYAGSVPDAKLVEEIKAISKELQGGR